MLFLTNFYNKNNASIEIHACFDHQKDFVKDQNYLSNLAPQSKSSFKLLMII